MATSTEIHPRQLSDRVRGRPRYGNYIGGKWVEPASGQYFENVTPVTGRAFCEIPRSNAQDIDRALDAAHAARAELGARRVHAPGRDYEPDCAADGRQS